MTADEARKMTTQAAVDPAKVRIVLDLWHNGIMKAAAAGRRSVRSSDLDVPRTPIPQAARKAALERLAADGYVVKVSATDSGVEVCW